MNVVFSPRDASPPLVLAFSGSAWCLRLVIVFSDSVLCLRLVVRDLYHTTKTLLAEYLTSYTNTLQLIDYQCFT